jgi:Holliday junction resolvasome RuvABC endonuclease subunit
VNIAAFDLSLTATGWARTEGTSGVLHPPKGMMGIERLVWIRDSVLRIAIGAGDTMPADVVVVEGYAFGAKGSAVISLGELGGVVRVALSEHALLGAPCVDIPPSCLKLFATGKGNAKKDVVFASAIRKLGYTGSDHNEADALWLLEMASAFYDSAALARQPAGNIETKTRALSKIKWPELAAV